MSWTYHNASGEPIIRDGEAINPEITSGVDAYSVPVVFDMESWDVPFPIGLYLRTDEDVVIYRHGSDTKAAPADCVTVVRVTVPRAAEPRLDPGTDSRPDPLTHPEAWCE